MSFNNVYNSNNASDLIGQQWDSQLQHAALDEADNQKASASLEGVKNALSDHFDEDTAIKSDADLNENGKKSRRIALIKKTDGKITALTGRRINDLKERAAIQANAVANSVNMTPSQSDTLEMIHRRELASEIDPLIRHVELEKMARDGSDDLTLHACLTASKLKPLTTPAEAATLRDLLAARLAPNQADELQKTRNHLALLESVKNVAHHQIASQHERSYLGIDAIPYA